MSETSAYEDVRGFFAAVETVAKLMAIPSLACGNRQAIFPVACLAHGPDRITATEGNATDWDMDEIAVRIPIGADDDPGYNLQRARLAVRHALEERDLDVQRMNAYADSIGEGS